VVIKLRTRPGPVRPEQQELRTRRKFLRRQRARRWLVWRRILAALGAVAVVAGLVWLVFSSSWLAVQGAEVSGTSVLSAAEVERTAAVPMDVPLATVDLAAIQARVEGLAAVESAEASRSWPDQVHIEVTEREAVAVVSWEGQWRGLDETGVLFRTYAEEPTGLPQITMRAATPIDVLAEAAAVVSALPGDILDRVELLDVRSIDSISLRFGSGASVSWGSADESEDKAAVLTVLMRNEPEARVYDVTAPGRPTIRR
jgi:cell division protein FtsQ